MLGNDADQREGGQAPDLLERLDGVVQVLDGEREADAQAEPRQEADQQVELLVRLEDLLGNPGRVDDPDVALPRVPQVRGERDLALPLQELVEGLALLGDLAPDVRVLDRIGGELQGGPLLALVQDGEVPLALHRGPVGRLGLLAGAGGEGRGLVAQPVAGLLELR